MGSTGKGLSAGRQLGSYCSDLMKKVVPHIIGELNSVRVRRESFISLNIQYTLALPK